MRCCAGRDRQRAVALSSTAKWLGCGSSAECPVLHTVSKKYLPLYVAKFHFRYNNRLNADIFGAAVKEC
jgi:hypothetical protein